MFLDYPRYEYMLASSQVALVMLAMGATLSLDDFIGIFRRPRSFLAGGVLQLVGVPLLALVFIRLFRLEPGVAVGLIVVAAMPGGSMSNLFTFLAKGNVALSIALTACATLGSLVSIPLILALFASEHMPAGFALPIDRVVGEVFLFLLLPLVAGYGFAQVARPYRGKLSRWAMRFALVLLAAMVVGSLGSGRIDPHAYGWRVPTAIILFCVVAQQLSMIPFRFLGWPSPDRIAVGMEVTVRNVNLALLVKASLFPAAAILTSGAEGVSSTAIADGVLFVVLYYGAVSLVASVPVMVIHRRMLRRRMFATQVDPVA
ncbi:Sodium Bile acid symporter family protein [Planctomycetes bacterium Pan216]|uniref:Sodium Bile acid symporter family protein n=1 Tax=Kolteria novifilia TaxID=2527975 RepID=A0A518B2Z5_9BACT|nr:Sodium Bile acid symporter family protein [Planctomycetes bacterium Pan216]